MDNMQLYLDELKKKAEKGDTEAIKALMELTQHEQEEQLRKDLFGV